MQLPPSCKSLDNNSLLLNLTFLLMCRLLLDALPVGQVAASSVKGSLSRKKQEIDM
jgi:hypothetical protein